MIQGKSPTNIDVSILNPLPFIVNSVPFKLNMELGSTEVSKS
jgi:hypothetical protein